MVEKQGRREVIFISGGKGLHPFVKLKVSLCQLPLFAPLRLRVREFCMLVSLLAYQNNFLINSSFGIPRLLATSAIIADNVPIRIE